MGDYATSKSTVYTIRIQGWLPADLGDKISRLHASALLDCHNSTDPQILDDGLEPHVNGDVELTKPFSDAG